MRVMRILLAVLAVMVGGCTGNVAEGHPSVRCGDVVVVCGDGHGGSPAAAWYASDEATAHFCDGANVPGEACPAGGQCVAIVDGASAAGTCK